MVAQQTKTFNVRLPVGMWEKFYRLLPEHGDRSRFVRRCIGHLITSKSNKISLPKELRRRIEMEGG